MKKGIIGLGGFGREVFFSLPLDEQKNAVFFVDDEYYIQNTTKFNVLPLSEFNPQQYVIVVAVGNPKDRFNIVEKLPNNTQFFTHIHPSVIIMDENIEIGQGSIICAGSILTTNIKIGKHTHLNLHTTVGHDTEIGDFFTSAPGVKISGNCKIGDRVYVGTNGSIKEKINICNDVTLGLNCGVVKNIVESGVFIGTPAQKML